METVEYDIEFFKAEKKRLEEKIKTLEEKLEKERSDNSWQYEYDHSDDWRKPVEMGML